MSSLFPPSVWLGSVCLADLIRESVWAELMFSSVFSFCFTDHRSRLSCACFGLYLLCFVQFLMVDTQAIALRLFCFCNLGFVAGECPPTEGRIVRPLGGLLLLCTEVPSCLPLQTVRQRLSHLFVQRCHSCHRESRHPCGAELPQAAVSAQSSFPTRFLLSLVFLCRFALW